ncbi:MAG: DUF6445 family protein, partial [Rhodanobacteraceae bacterium]
SLERIDLEGLVPQASRCVGEPLRLLTPPQSHGKCRITLAADTGRAKVHIDPLAYWSGILYLSRPEDCRGGTEFFRHRPTRSDRAPLNRQELSAMSYPTPQAMHADIIEKDGNDDSKWEMTMQVPMRYNRLLLLSPRLWHAAGQSFGDRLDNGRLVYLMFFGLAQRCTVDRMGAERPRQQPFALGVACQAGEVEALDRRLSAPALLA